MQADSLPLSSASSVLCVVPMFHANSWGLVFAAPMVGAKLVLPGEQARAPAAVHMHMHVFWLLSIPAQRLCHRQHARPRSAGWSMHACIRAILFHDHLALFRPPRMRACLIEQAGSVARPPVRAVPPFLPLRAGPFLDGGAIYELIESQRVTMSAGVPTVWLQLLAHMDERGLRFSSMTHIGIGGAAPPPSMIDALETKCARPATPCGHPCTPRVAGSWGNQRHAAPASSMQRALRRCPAHVHARTRECLAQPGLACGCPRMHMHCTAGTAWTCGTCGA